MDIDRNLLFGVLALQGDLIRPDQFVEACTAWANRNQWLVALPMEIGLVARQQCRPSQQRRVNDGSHEHRLQEPASTVRADGGRGELPRSGRTGPGHQRFVLCLRLPEHPS
jgi:hypothetical protein